MITKTQYLLRGWILATLPEFGSIYRDRLRVNVDSPHQFITRSCDLNLNLWVSSPVDVLLYYHPHSSHLNKF